MPVLKNSVVFEEPDPPPHLAVGSVVVVPNSTAPVTERDNKPKRTDLPKVAIIVDDIGYNYKIGQQLLEMPLELTFSFLPFAPYTKQLENAAHVLGKTVLLHLPLQPQSSRFDPGPGALMLADSAIVQIEKLRRCLDEVPHAVGVNNHMGSLFTQDTDAMQRIMVELSRQELFFVDSYTTSASVALEVALKSGVKSARRHVFLDNVLNQEQICGQLEKLVDVALKGGVGIGIAHPHEVTLSALKSCVPLYESKVQYVSVWEVL